MFFSNSQRVNLAWGISAVLFCVRVLLQCLVGTSRSILGYVVWHCWVVWRPIRICKVGFLQWLHAIFSQTEWSWVTAPCHVPARLTPIRHHLVPFKGWQTSRQGSLKQSVNYFEEKHLRGEKAPKPNGYQNNCACATIWTPLTGGPRRTELCVPHLSFQPNSARLAESNP